MSKHLSLEIIKLLRKAYKERQDSSKKVIESQVDCVLCVEAILLLTAVVVEEHTQKKYVENPKDNAKKY